ncbi:alpha/beta hydrolase-fold protein [Klebsiella pneumoniae]|nr:alpha/beta hydrolase-fold protein [Klebsiella pneumoniae]
MLYWLSGLTCNDEEHHQGGRQRHYRRAGHRAGMPDTSPRGDEAANDDDFDLRTRRRLLPERHRGRPGLALLPVYDYRDELPTLIRSEFSVGERCAVLLLDGRPRHTLIITQKIPGRYASVSAFAPIVQSSVELKAFTAYLGADESAWLLGRLCADAGQPAGGRRCRRLSIGRQQSIPLPDGYSRRYWRRSRQRRPLTLRIQPVYDQLLLHLLVCEDHLLASMRSISLAKRQCAAKLLRGACSWKDAFGARQ